MGTVSDRVIERNVSVEEEAETKGSRSISY